MTGKQSANCLCEAVSISAELPNEIGACHCNICRRWGGGAFMTIHAGSDVEITGIDNVTVYDSSEWAERGFCKHCGTHLFYRLKAQNDYFLAAGLFQDQPEQTFTHQVFIDEKPKYYNFSETTQDMTGTELFAQFEEET